MTEPMHSPAPVAIGGVGGSGTRVVAAILQALCMAEVYHELVRRLGWSAEEYQAWLAQVLKCELLGCESRGG